MIRKCFLMACGLFLMGSVTVGATHWKSVYTDEYSTLTEYVDTDSIQKQKDGETRNAWLKFTDASGKGLFLVSVSKDGMVRLLKAPDTNTMENMVIATDWTYMEPDTPLSYAYDKIWPVKDRKKSTNPNRWEQKGEHTVDRACDRVINKVLDRIGWGW